MPNITFQEANLPPPAKTMPDFFTQCLYSSGQRWEGIIAQICQTYPLREPMHFMQSAGSMLVLHLQGVVDLQRQSDGRTEQGRSYKGGTCLEPLEVPPTYSVYFCQGTPVVVLY